MTRPHTPPPHPDHVPALIGRSGAGQSRGLAWTQVIRRRVRFEAIRVIYFEDKTGHRGGVIGFSDGSRLPIPGSRAPLSTARLHHEHTPSDLPRQDFGRGGISLPRHVSHRFRTRPRKRLHRPDAYSGQTKRRGYCGDVWSRWNSLFRRTLYIRRSRYRCGRMGGYHRWKCRSVPSPNR